MWIIINISIKTKENPRIHKMSKKQTPLLRLESLKLPLQTTKKKKKIAEKGFCTLYPTVQRSNTKQNHGLE